MASSTRKWRKQQKEYNRRRRQATRRAQEAAQRAEEAAQKQREKERENERMQKLQAALGYTAAQGFGRNIFSGILASSKGQQENYLTASLRKKRLAEAPRLRYEKKMREYEEYPYSYSSKLHFAVEKKDPELVQYILEQGDTNVNLEDQARRNTALEHALRDLVAVNMSYNEGNEYAEQESYDNLHQIIGLLINAGASIRAQTLSFLWQQPPSEIQYLLDTFPVLKEKTIEFQAEILQMLHQNITELEIEIHEIGLEEEFVRNGEHSGYYRVHVPNSYYTELDALYASINNLRRFLETYNSKSGEYSLE